MRSALHTLCARLPLDRRSRRALDETLADWAYEIGAATTRLQFAIALGRSLMAVIRATVATVGEEVRRIPAGPVAARLLLVLLVPVALLSLAGWGHVAWRGDATMTQRITLALCVTPQATLALLPLALFLVTAAHVRQRPLPALGIAAAALFVALVAAAWMLPTASRAFHETVNAMRSPTVGVSAFVAAPDMGPLDLARAAAQRPMSPAMGVLLFRMGLAVMAAAFVVLGSVAGSLPVARRRAFAAIVTLGYAAAVLLLPSNWELGGHAPALVGLLPWSAAALALGLAFTVGNSARTEGAER